jgi:hypothetical protein
MRPESCIKMAAIPLRKLIVIVTFGSAQVSRSRQLICKLGGFMNQDWQMLGADPQVFASIVYCNQGDFVGVAFAIKAVRLVGGHK